MLYIILLVDDTSHDLEHELFLQSSYTQQTQQTPTEQRQEATLRFQFESNS